MAKKKSGEKTLLWSVLMSAPGPLIVGLGLRNGRSATQIADFVRRSAELLAIVMSFVAYKAAAKSGEDAAKGKRVERVSALFTGIMMCVGGLLMVLLALLGGNNDKGNALPGLVIAVMGVVANSIFWHRYAQLNRSAPNEILKAQSSLYRAKTMVDGCVTAALFAVVIAPAAKFSQWLDFCGSLAVALYLIRCGIGTVLETAKKKD